MKYLLHVLRFDWKSLTRSRTLMALLFVVLGAGIYGIYFGKFEIEKQNSHIFQAKDHERSTFDSLLTWIQLDTSIEANREKYQKAVSPTGVGWAVHFTYCVPHTASATAGLCMGQRDLYPTHYRINMTNLSSQMNIAELANPMKLLEGNFDLSYVFVFLLPLLLISMFYDLYSAEKENGTLPLLLAQPVGLPLVLLGKGLLRLLIVWGVAVVLMLLGFILQGVSVAANVGLMVQWLTVVLGYTTLWAVLMAGIVVLKQSSSVSAMLGLGAWLIFTVVTPALLNLLVTAREPLPNRTEAMHVIRTLNDKHWESPKSYVLDRFYALNPQYAEEDTLHFYKWYYANLALIDHEVSGLNDQYEAQIDRRNSLLAKWSWLAPGAWVHQKFAQLSGTDRESHLAFIGRVKDHHGKLKELYYRRIFNEEVFSYEDLEQLEKSL